MPTTLGRRKAAYVQSIQVCYIADLGAEMYSEYKYADEIEASHDRFSNPYISRYMLQ